MNMILLYAQLQHLLPLPFTQHVVLASPTEIAIDLKWFESSLSIFETFTSDLPWVITHTGSPEGVRAASPGATCQDVTNGALYVRETGAGIINTGWAVV